MTERDHSRRFRRDGPHGPGSRRRCSGRGRPACWSAEMDKGDSLADASGAGQADGPGGLLRPRSRHGQHRNGAGSRRRPHRRHDRACRRPTSTIVRDLCRRHELRGADRPELRHRRGLDDAVRAASRQVHARCRDHRDAPREEAGCALGNGGQDRRNDRRGPRGALRRRPCPRTPSRKSPARAAAKGWGTFPSIPSACPASSPRRWSSSAGWARR